MTKIEVGEIVNGKVTGIQPYGVFVRLTDECTGLIHVSNMTNSIKRSQRRLFKIGWTITVEILALNIDKTQAELKFHKAPERLIFGKSKRPQGQNDEYDNGFAPLAQVLPIWIKQTIRNRRRKKR